MLNPGDQAPSFTLSDHTGQPTTLKEFLDCGPLLLFFYPADFSPVCTREACLFRDRYAELAAAGVQVAGISTNTAESHRRFGERNALPYPLLADPDKVAIRAFGVDGPLGIGLRRASFLIDRDGTIRLAVRADLRLKPHAALIEEALAASASES